MGSEVTSIFITGCFWYWTVCKITVTILPLCEESRWHQRLANLAFAMLIAIQGSSFFLDPLIAVWVVGVLSAITVVFILVLSKFDREGFWSKPRNQVVGSLVILGCGIALPLFLKESSLVGLFFAVILAHEFHKSQVKQFTMIHQDLDSIRGKVAKLEAALQNARVEKNASEQPSKISVFYPHDHQKVEKRQHH